MEISLEVYVPGPWWHALTYRFDRPLPPGVRVRVPVGRGHRVGFVAPDGPSPPPGQGELKEIEDVLDGAPPLGEELGRLASWIGVNYLCGTPLALGRIAPGFLLRGQGAFQEDLPVRASSGDSEDAFVFDPRDDRRWGRYREEIGGVSGGVLALFGEQSDAARFWDLLPDGERGRGILWPSSGGRALQRAWEAVRSGERSLVVGGRGALFAPLRDLRLVMVDEEASGGHRFVDPPFLHARTVASQRARLWRSRFLAGGRMPSARLFRLEGGRGSERPGDRLFFVDLRRTDAVAVAGVRDPLRIGAATFRETKRAVQRGMGALWILDRKGYASEVACAECGAPLRCPSCGGTCRWERGRYACPFCGTPQAQDPSCSVCRGILLQGLRPGIETLWEAASDLFRGDFPVIFWAGGKRGTLEARRALRKSGGVVLGTRGALALCDHLSVGCVAWIDADAEARQPRYDARFVAFRMIWESLWRGGRCEDRTVVVQSRSPLRGWQESLPRGWGAFWAREMEERRLYNLPPYRPLLSLEAGLEDKEALRKALESQGVEVLDPGLGDGMLWARPEHLGAARRALEPFFRIRRKGPFPRIVLERE